MEAVEHISRVMGVLKGMRPNDEARGKEAIPCMT